VEKEQKKNQAQGCLNWDEWIETNKRNDSRIMLAASIIDHITRWKFKGFWNKEKIKAMSKVS